MFEQFGNPDSWMEGKGRVSPKHGCYLGRLPRGAQQTDESLGYTMWHLLAAKCLCPSTQLQFLQSATEERMDVLIDDIRECCAVISGRGWQENWMTWAPNRRGSYKRRRFGWRALRERTAWKTPLEICAELNVPLIHWPEGYEHFGEKRFHPVIMAAQAESLKFLK